MWLCTKFDSFFIFLQCIFLWWKYTYTYSIYNRALNEELPQHWAVLLARLNITCIYIYIHIQTHKRTKGITWRAPAALSCASRTSEYNIATRGCIAPICAMAYLFCSLAARFHNAPAALAWTMGSPVCMYVCMYVCMWDLTEPWDPLYVCIYVCEIYMNLGGVPLYVCMHVSEIWLNPGITCMYVCMYVCDNCSVQVIQTDERIHVYTHAYASGSWPTCIFMWVSTHMHAHIQDNHTYQATSGGE